MPIPSALVSVAKLRGATHCSCPSSIAQRYSNTAAGAKTTHYDALVSSGAAPGVTAPTFIRLIIEVSFPPAASHAGVSGTSTEYTMNRFSSTFHHQGLQKRVMNISV